jgi:hypothetical protein
LDKSFAAEFKKDPKLTNNANTRTMLFEPVVLAKIVTNYLKEPEFLSIDSEWWAEQFCDTDIEIPSKLCGCKDLFFTEMRVRDQ